MSEQTSRLLEVVDLTKHFPIRRGFVRTGTPKVVKAVDGVSFYIENGKSLGLVGESGSGKTTTARLVLRGIEPTAGHVYFQLKKGEIIDFTALHGNELRHFRIHAQMIFQDPYSSLDPRMTVRDIIGEPLVSLGVAKGSELDDRVCDVARLCRLDVDHLRRYPHAFSAGQRQRIGIARALVLKPRLLICDEPVSSLDVSIQAEVLNLLKDLQAELSLTYLFISHDLSVVEHVSDSVAVMYLGRLVEMAPGHQLYFSPLHPYTEALMSAIPIADPDAVMNPIMLQGEIPSPANPPSGCHFHPRCRFAQDICSRCIPEWKACQPDHYVACHFAGTLDLRGCRTL